MSDAPSVPTVEGLEHKDSRLHAAEGADWRDKLAVLRRDLPADDSESSDDADEEGDGPRRATE